MTNPLLNSREWVFTCPANHGNICQPSSLLKIHPWTEVNRSYKNYPMGTFLTLSSFSVRRPTIMLPPAPGPLLLLSSSTWNTQGHFSPFILELNIFHRVGKNSLSILSQFTAFFCKFLPTHRSLGYGRNRKFSERVQWISDCKFGERVKGLGSLDAILCRLLFWLWLLSVPWEVLQRFKNHCCIFSPIILRVWYDNEAAKSGRN